MLASNIFIASYVVQSSLMDEYTDNDDMIFEDDGDQTSGSLSVIMEHKGKYYEFLMYKYELEISVYIIRIQTIKFLQERIVGIKPEAVIDYFTTVSSPLIPHEINEKSHREAGVSLIKMKLETIHHLINEKRLTVISI